MTRTAAARLLVAIVFYAALGFAAAWAHAETQAGRQGDVEEVGDVSEVKPPAAKPAFLDLVSRLHPPLVHMPIAWLMLLVMIDGATFLLGRPWEKAGLYVLALAVASCVPAVTTGFLREDCIKGGADIKALITVHKWMAISTTGLCSLALILRLALKNELITARKYAYLVIIFTAGAFVMLVGHKGGQIVFGKDFMPL